MSNLRDYSSNARVQQFYRELYLNQNYNYVIKKLEQYSKLDKERLKMTDVLKMMNTFVDPSDPDIESPNSFHAYQTAEAIRRDYPNDKGFQVCGLIHDLGKILFYFGEPSWGIVGDTFVVGCPFPKTVVHYDETKSNSDVQNDLYQSGLGLYRANCGIENLVISYGHDEYLYRVLTGNNTRHHLPERFAKMIRFHSFYPWHTGGEYRDLMQKGDEELLKDVCLLNSYDLYSKGDTSFKLTQEIRDYYDTLLERFFPEPLCW